MSALTKTDHSCYRSGTSPAATAAGREAASGRSLLLFGRPLKSAPVVPPSSNANLYIDGCNLYHGGFDDSRDLACRAHWRQYRWLDLGTRRAQLFARYSMAGPGLAFPSWIGTGGE